MKNAKLCPKCDSHDIVRLPVRFSLPANPGAAHDRLPALTATRHICCKCGYSEEWFDEVAELANAKEQLRG